MQAWNGMQQTLHFFSDAGACALYLYLFWDPAKTMPTCESERDLCISSYFGNKTELIASPSILLYRIDIAWLARRFLFLEIFFPAKG